MYKYLTALGVVFAILCSVASASAAKASFYDRQDYYLAAPGAGGSQAIAVSDFDGDGIPDLISAGFVFLGIGNGKFRPAPPSPSINGAAYAATDLNNDGKIDLVFSGAADGVNGPFGIGVCFGNGDGTFQPQVFYQAGSDKSFNSIVLADFNGDGILDVSTQAESGVWLFSGNGVGSFNAGVLIPSTQLGDSGNVLSGVDINGDGTMDLVASTQNGFAALLGNGDGTFRPQINTVSAFNTYPGGITVADLNDDGRPDVIVVNNYVGYNYVLVYLGRGDGTFLTPIPVTLPGFINVAVGDLNGDRIPDLVSDNGYIAFGHGNGTFAAPVYYPVSDSANSVIVADLRNNGRLDIVTQDIYDTISVLLNQGRGAFEDGVWSPLAGGEAGCAASMDFNGDGHPDLAVRVDAGVSVLFGTGSISKPFVQGEVIPLANSNCVFAADFNGDGIPDLLALSLAPAPATTAFLTIYLGKGDGTFTQKSVTSIAHYARVALGDFNGDGKIDFATSTNLLALGNGNGTFQTPVSYIPLIPPNDQNGFSNIGAADLNGDGLTDVVLTDVSFNYVYVLLNTRSGKFKETSFGTQQFTQACISPFIPVFGDLNGDGFPDLTLGCVDGNVPLYLNDGKGNFTYSKGLVESVVSDFMQPIIADLNGDGIPDIAVLTDYDVAVFFGKGGLSFTSPIYLGTGTFPAYMLEVNLHGQTPQDGTPDIVVPDNAQGKVLSILNLTK